MKYIINLAYKTSEAQVINFVKSFKTEGILFGDGKRNIIKLFDLDGKTINIKSFKIPNLVNKIAYKYFRKSKARRSFEYATLLLEKGIGTPEPIAFFENYNWIGLKDSYYVSEHLECDLTYRELVEIPEFPDNENILRQFTQFSFHLHQNGVEFLDHSPGNTLIKKSANGKYEFFLVDLNRMNFHSQMDFDQRMKNLSRLTPQKDMVAIMSNEYAKWYSAKTEQEIFEKMWFYTTEFQEKFQRKQKLKKKLKFWKS
ncbi:lipopolysaccharide kinase InaA family protein [Flavobacterium sp.]|uniref:lipopolysaccharide kinase InaA family protein n=1 Tax=Flavobacterium sp. TaxID=239 RepID=UPI002CA622F7|nr:lipopolysaccharide kinase InaA family protein [Flavobacterium sp.]HSD06761.1 lipopolysaccharide kinase InaA family protein [Flavobacterium sp.]